MAETKIEWTDATWNPVAGCSIMSAGCKNCYAMAMAKRLDAMRVEKYKGLTKTVNGNPVWTGKITLDEKSLDIPYKWKKPRNIFVNSMSDLFHPNVPVNFIKKIWKVMHDTPHHNYQILTKRPDIMLEIIVQEEFPTLPNVWLGTTIEDSRVAHRIKDLEKVSAKIRFVSFEPLIGSVGHIDLTNIQWAIVGGESGHKARPMSPGWVGEIKDLCEKYNTAFFFKQWGTWGEDNKRRSKQANGREYQGEVFNNMPIVGV